MWRKETPRPQGEAKKASQGRKHRSSLGEEAGRFSSLDRTVLASLEGEKAWDVSGAANSYTQLAHQEGC